MQISFSWDFFYKDCNQLEGAIHIPHLLFAIKRVVKVIFREKWFKVSPEVKWKPQENVVCKCWLLRKSPYSVRIQENADQE